MKPNNFLLPYHQQLLLQPHEQPLLAAHPDWQGLLWLQPQALPLLHVWASGVGAGAEASAGCEVEVSVLAAAGVDAPSSGISYWPA
jgi:hypothetical protein